MATIAQIVAQIRTAIFGKDVRENIAQGIEKCYTDVSSGVTLAEKAASNANTKATAAQTAADIANSAATNANTAATTINTKIENVALFKDTEFYEDIFQLRTGVNINSVGRYTSSSNWVAGYGSDECPFVYAGTKITANEGYKFSYSLWDVPVSASASLSHRIVMSRDIAAGTTIMIEQDGYLAFSCAYADESALPEVETPYEFANEAVTVELLIRTIKHEISKTNANISDIAGVIDDQIAPDIDELEDGLFVEQVRQLTWNTGAWNNSGDLNTSSKHIKTEPFQADKFVVKVNPGYYLMIGKWSYYTAMTSATFVENIVGNYSNMSDVREYEFEGGANYWYRIAIKKSDNSDIDTSVSSNVQQFDKINRINEKASKSEVSTDLLAKLNVPASGYGTSGQILTSNGTSSPIWEDYEPISGDAVKEAVDEWLEDNPQAFVQIEDGSIEEIKFNKNALRYVTPEMFGAKADGVTSDSEPMQAAIDYAEAHGCVLDGKGKTYYLDGSGTLPPGWTESVPIRGLSITSSLTIQNMNLYIMDDAILGTSALHVECEVGDRIIIDRVNIDGNILHQSTGVQGDGNYSGIKIGRASLYERGCGSIEVKNCNIKDCFTDGIIVGTAKYENIVIRDCVIETCGRNGITDGGMNTIVSGCFFKNNGVRTEPRTQYETEPEQVREYKTRILKDCIFISDYDNINDIVFLFKMEKVAQGTSDSIDHLIIENCQCKMIAIQSQTMNVPSVFRHITIKDTSCEEIRFAPANNAIAVNKNMEIINCNVKSINVQVGNLKVIGCTIDGTMNINLDKLIMIGNDIAKESASVFAPVADSAVVDGNIFTNYTLNQGSVSHFLGSNIMT